MKLLTKFGIVPLLVLFLAVAMHAEPVSQLHPTGYINDFAHVLQPRYIAQMEGICQQADQKAHAQIALVTINTLDGADIEGYAVNLYKAWGIGGKASNRGVLILYVIKDRKARVEVGYGLEPILPDGKVGGFQREAIPLMRSGDYNQALMLVTNRIVAVVAQDAGVQISNVLPQGAYRAPARQSAPQHITLGGVVIAVIVLIIVLCTPLRGILFWILLSQLGGGRGGGFGGGFGGGGGGGGGFGGFGGGSSGGGGSSSNW